MLTNNYWCGIIVIEGKGRGDTSGGSQSKRQSSKFPHFTKKNFFKKNQKKVLTNQIKYAIIIIES